MSLEDLYRFGKLEKHKTTPQEIRELFGVAGRCLADAAQGAVSTELRFIAAYQAALAAGEAFLRCLGYKAPKTNYHYMTWEALRQALGESFKKTIILFNDARTKRADAFYDKTSVTSETEFSEIFSEAKKFVSSMRDKIKKEFPNLAGRI